MFQLDVEHSVPSAHYTHRVDILVVWAYVQIALPDTKKSSEYKFEIILVFYNMTYKTVISFYFILHWIDMLINFINGF